MKIKFTLTLASVIVLTGCVNNAPKPDNPHFAPIQPIAYEPVRAMNGSLYSAATSMNLYGDGRAFRVGV